jgi:hypothetical protein
MNFVQLVIVSIQLQHNLHLHNFPLHNHQLHNPQLLNPQVDVAPPNMQKTSTAMMTIIMQGAIMMMALVVTIMLQVFLRVQARTYLQPHYGNGVFGNVYLLAGQQ